MENTTVGGLRSRSRSKTPFLRSSCDRESCNETDEHTHKSERKTPVKRSTPVKQLEPQSKPGKGTETIIEEVEDLRSPSPVHRTRGSIKTAAEKLIKTSDYSSEESPDRLRGNNTKEAVQNHLNYKYEYERVSTSTQRRAAGLPDVSLSPIHGYNVTADRSTRFGSPAYSGCSSDSSFAEQALADASLLLDRDRDREHLPSRLYRMAGEYWNKYPKTDYTYSPLSKDRVELAPGQVAVPNMSRRSLQQFRIQGPNTSQDEVDELVKSTWSTKTIRKRYNNVDSSDDEGYPQNGSYTPIKQRWWITTFIISIITTVTTTVTSNVEAAYRKLVGPSHRYPYTDRRVKEVGLLKRTGSAVSAPFYWIYTVFRKIVTTTVTTITETISTPTTTTANHAGPRPAAARRWAWLLLLLLPLVGYGCYRSDDVISTMPEKQESTHTYKAPLVILNDPDLTRRVAALEDWAVSLDSKLNSFDQKLQKIDNFQAKFESFSLKHLQQNLVQVFNLNSENGEAVAAKLKDYFDKHYVHKDQVSSMSQDLYERLMNSIDQSADEEKMHKIVKEYLAVFERRQTEVLVEKVKEYVKEVQVHRVESGFDVEAVKRIVAGMLNIYDADKTGLVDYALESAGGQVISTKCTELYQIKTKQYFVLGLPVWWVNTSPRNALTPGAMPAECWAFQGFPGYLVVRTYAIIEVTGFSMEHMSRLLAVDGKIESAPKNFSVYGLRDELDAEPHLFGDYMYDANGTAIQHFPVKHPRTEDIAGVRYPVAHDIIELRVESNHGNPTYTCVYRFRVHGNPLSDIRRATEDSLRDSEP